MFSSGLSTFQPKQIPNIKLWLDASNVSNGSNPAGGAAVSSWVDLSGVSGNAGQATVGQRPTFQVNIRNGLPAVQFSSAASQCLQVSSISVGSQITVFAVIRQLNPNTWFIEQSPDINSNDGFYMFGNGFAMQAKNSGVNAMTANIAGWLGSSTALGMVRYNGTDAVAWLNGALYPGSTGTGSITNNTVTNVLNIGSRNQSGLFFNGYLHELIIYNSPLTDAQVGLVNEYLRRKWAIY